MYFSLIIFFLILIKYFEGFYSTDTTILSIEVVMICLLINIMLHVTLKKILVKYCHYVNQYWGASNLVY